MICYNCPLNQIGFIKLVDLSFLGLKFRVADPDPGIRIEFGIGVLKSSDPETNPYMKYIAIESFKIKFYQYIWTKWCIKSNLEPVHIRPDPKLLDNLLSSFRKKHFFVVLISNVYILQEQEKKMLLSKLQKRSNDKFFE